LRTGLTALPDLPAVVVSLVDLPDVGARVVERLLARDVTMATLTRAAYGGTPGHPVVIGSDHWAGVVAAARGDRGARDYLATHEVELVECGDLATGRDVDTTPTGGQPGAE
jgi:CTP:molybdopterin cytidylyltransferase MocA